MQKVQVIDITKSYLPGDPNSYPENLISTDREDGEEKTMPVLPFEAYNILPTAYGYRSYFGIDSTLVGDAAPANCDQIILFQKSDYSNMMIAFTAAGVYTRSGTATAWTQTFALTDTWTASSIYKEYTWIVLENDLYIYRQGHTHVLKIAYDGTATTFIPSFLNMAGQMGIFKAHGRLGFWDSLNSVSWSSALDYTNFTPDLETLAGNCTFLEVQGRIVTIRDHGEGFIIYATKSIVGIGYNTQGTQLWDAMTLTQAGGIGYPRAVVMGENNKQHFAYTSIGIFMIGHFNALSRQYDMQQIAPELFDFLKESRDPVYLDCFAGRYLHFGLLDARYINGITSFVDPNISVYEESVWGNAQFSSDSDILATATGLSFTAATPALTGNGRLEVEAGSAYIVETDNSTSYITYTLPTDTLPLFDEEFAFNYSLRIVPNDSVVGDIIYPYLAMTGDFAGFAHSPVFVDSSLYFEYAGNNLWTVNWATDSQRKFLYNSTLVTSTQVATSLQFDGRNPVTVSIRFFRTGGELLINGTKWSEIQGLAPFAIGEALTNLTVSFSAPIDRLGVWRQGRMVAVEHFTLATITSYQVTGSTLYKFGCPLLTDFTLTDNPGNILYRKEFNSTDLVTVVNDGQTNTTLSFPASELPAVQTVFAAPEWYLGYDYYIEYHWAASYGYNLYLFELDLDVGAITFELEITPTNWPDPDRTVNIRFLKRDDLYFTFQDNIFTNISWYDQWNTIKLVKSFNTMFLEINGVRAEITLTIPDSLIGTRAGQTVYLFEHYLNNAAYATFAPIAGFKNFYLVEGPESYVARDTYYNAPSFLLQAGSISPAYPEILGSLVFDLQLKKWGKNLNSHRCLISLSPLNETQNQAISFTNFGVDSGILKYDDRTIRLFSPYVTDSLLKYGKIGFYRFGFSVAQEVVLHFRIPSTGSVTIEGSINGKEIDSRLETTTSFTEAVEVTAYIDKSARWFNIAISGQFDLTYLEFRGTIAGRR